MFELTQEYIKNISSEDMKTLCELDANGLIVGKDEDTQAYKTRLISLCECRDNLEKSLSSKEYIEIEGMKLSQSSRIDRTILSAASKIPSGIYSFSIDWVPGFFLSERIGPLWGGCAIYFPEKSFSIFLIRADFKEKEKWFIYTRTELLAHELCHIARMPLLDRSFEEYFAYKISSSAFRRIFGNCFQNQIDALLFLIPIFPILLGAEIIKTTLELSYPMYPFWILALIYPAFLLIRNFISRFYVNRARKHLDNIDCARSDAVLFRCTKEEIKKIASLSQKQKCINWIKNQAHDKLRWKIIVHRFFQKL